jgi:hypothetical protein
MLQGVSSTAGSLGGRSWRTKLLKESNEAASESAIMDDRAMNKKKRSFLQSQGDTRFGKGGRGGALGKSMDEERPYRAGRDGGINRKARKAMKKAKTDGFTSDIPVYRDL